MIQGYYSHLLHTLVEAALSSARATVVAVAKLPSCRAAALSPTVGTAAFAAATILSHGWRRGTLKVMFTYIHTPHTQNVPIFPQAEDDLQDPLCYFRKLWASTNQILEARPKYVVCAYKNTRYMPLQLQWSYMLHQKSCLYLNIRNRLPCPLLVSLSNAWTYLIQ